ncbi:hypothetical protein A3Q56_01708 [Intoshia linei]|uniref:Uncharacterized protein n=1 Tax=Intoshia linei TaxID=1819745 RepID=A0A177B8B1_9BILA|nr:hypothetical protein A3Q56_01708 [Intoshia linei]
MPKLDDYGSQPPIELLRQFQDFRGFYDRFGLFWKNIHEDVTLCAACGPPGGGRNAITPRFVRHFSVFSLSPPSEYSLKHIFSVILTGFFDEFNMEIKQVVDNMLNVAVEMYIRMSVDLLPTPDKSHYIFNLRDLSKCVQGLTRADKNIIKTQKDVVELFTHESLRVFHDRLVNIEDKRYFYKMMSELISKNLNETIPPEDFETDPIIFGDYGKINANMDDRIYEKIDIDKIAGILMDYLQEYNLAGQKEMKLVFFRDAIEHVSRIVRIIRQTRGNAVLVGVGGTGKKSLTALASFICNYTFFQIELTRGYDSKSFHEDLQKLYMLTAVKNKNTVFMFTDSNIISEDFLEDVNNILNSGEVPNLFDAEEYEKLIIGCRPDAKEAGISEGNREAIYNFAISRVRNNLHIVLCMSPVGRAFRNRCIMFPSLVNCCTIDWFTVWPKEALLNVSNSLLSQLDIGSNEIMDKLSKICAEIHLGVGEIAERFYLELKRRYYTTPTSYLELLTMYIGMVSEKKTQLTNSLNRISSGLKKLKETNELVDTMKGEMVLLKPELEKKSKNTEELMEKLIIDQDKADAVRKIVAHDKANAAEKSKETQTIAEDAQRDLNEALPALESAVKALDSLDKNDISEIRVFQKPPELVQTVMEAVCLLLNAKQDWASAKNVLGESNFLRRLYDYDKDSIPESILKKLKKYIDNPKFTPEAVDRVSKAAKSLCMWVRAIDLYAHVFRTVEPKRKRLAEAEKENKIVQDALMVQQQKLSDVEDEITKLQQTYEDSVAEKHSLEKNMSLTQARIKRSGKLTMALADENEHWKCSIASIEIEIANVVGNVFLSAACIAYYGAFTSSYRELLATSWAERLKELEIPISDEASLISVMGTPFQIRQWNIEGLPRDRLSTENAIIVTRSRRWPLMIDPQEQAYRWIKSRENVNSIKIIKMTDSSFLSTIENCIRVGIPVLIEDIGETIDPAIEPILAKQTYVEGGRMLIRLGDSDIDYDMNFRLYITTKMPNPHYMPDVCILVTIINFTVTQDGLEDQLLSDVVRLERPDLEEQKNELIIKINNDKNQLKAIEDRILKLLFESEGNILDNEELIDTLNDSKITSDQISIRLEETEQTEKKIQYARDKYRPVAIRGSIMYFIVADLAQIDKMYQFSLKYFKSLFNGTIENSEKNKNLKLRLDIILTNTTWDVYRNVSRGLFEDDKVTFSFLLCTAIMKIEKEISDLEWHIYLHGVPESKEVKIENPFNENIPNNLWQNMVYLNKNLLMFKNIHLSILMKNIAITLGNKTTIVNSFLKDIDLSGNDNILEIINKDKSEIMFDFDESLSLFQKLLLIRCLDKKYVVGGSVELVKLRIGSQFIESPPSNMQTLYQDLNKIRPLIFILSPGSDPMSGLMRFAKDMSYEHRVHAISLGQGQGPIAEKIINSSAENGDWVYLQNCHLAASWMISMENLIKNQSENPENINEDFRLFLSSMPSPCFPISVLQNGAKVTNEPPKGIKANMRKAFNELTVAFFEENALGLPWRKIISSICFFHSVILERKKFGPIGWNIKYEFNDSDRETALLNFEMFCGDSIKWDALTYITGEITYGGRVTDYWDQRCLTTILTNFFNKNCIKSDYKFSKSGIYYAPNVATINENIDYIENLPITDDPEIFSMHDNANIIYQIQEANRLLNAIISLSPQIGSSVTGQSNEEIVYSKCESFQERIPQLINKETIRPEYFNTDAKDRISSITTVLLQETDRYNNLLSLIHKTLADLKKAIKGLLVMDTKLYDIFMSFINNKLPKLWADNAYPSMMNLNTWVFDLMMRCNFIQNWIDVTIPKSFWISGFFYPQGFLTALLQNYGRKYSYPIDHLSFHYKILKIYRNHRDVYESSLTLKYGDTLPMDEQIEVPNDGVLIHGLFMDGFRWNNKKGRVEDCLMGEIISSLPIVHMEPRMDYKPVKNVYRAPLYKTSARYGVLTTTGHSSNFVVVINLPTNHSSDYWILKGAALLCQKE